MHVAPHETTQTQHNKNYAKSINLWIPIHRRRATTWTTILRAGCVSANAPSGEFWSSSSMMAEHRRLWWVWLMGRASSGWKGGVGAQTTNNRDQRARDTRNTCVESWSLFWAVTQTRRSRKPIDKKSGKCLSTSKLYFNNWKRRVWRVALEIG